MGPRLASQCIVLLGALISLSAAAETRSTATMACSTTYMDARGTSVDLPLTIAFRMIDGAQVVVTDTGRLLFHNATFHFRGFPAVEGKTAASAGPGGLSDKSATYINFDGVMYFANATNQDLSAKVATFDIDFVPNPNFSDQKKVRRNWVAKCSQASGASKR